MHPFTHQSFKDKSIHSLINCSRINQSIHLSIHSSIIQRSFNPFNPSIHSSIVQGSINKSIHPSINLFILFSPDLSCSLFHRWPSIHSIHPFTHQLFKDQSINSSIIQRSFNPFNPSIHSSIVQGSINQSIHSLIKRSRINQSIHPSIYQSFYLVLT